MNPGDLSLQLLDEDGFTIVRIEGSLLRANHEELLARLEVVAQSTTRGVALDFEGVDYMDSSALGACAAVAKVMRLEESRPFCVFGANRTVARMWAMVGLERAIPLLEDRAAALAHMKEETA